MTARDLARVAITTFCHPDHYLYSFEFMDEEVGYSDDGHSGTSLSRKRKNLTVDPSVESHRSTDHATVPTQQCPRDRSTATPIRFLCSETFVDQWSDLVADLATTFWRVPSHAMLLDTNGNKCLAPEGSRIGFVDTSLLDLASVDVETRDNGAMIFCLLSVTIASGFPPLLKRVIDIASLSRYTTLEIIICVDVPFDASIEEIAKLQNATMQYRGMPTTVVCFNLVSPDSLASFTAESLLLSFDPSPPSTGTLDFDTVERHLEDRRTWERLLFLLSLIPSLSVTHALVIAQGFDWDDGELWLTRCLERWRTAPEPTNGTWYHAVMKQLSFVLSTPLGSKR